MVQVALELYTAMHVLVGTVETGRLRLSDYLNDKDVGVVPLQEAWVADLARPGAEPLLLQPANFRKQDVIVAVATDGREAVGNQRPGWVRTRPIEVAASAGPYLVQGQLHVQAGASFDVRRLFGPESRTFVPLTDASVRYTPNPRVDARYGVLLLRTDKVEFSGLVAEAGAASIPMLGLAIRERLRSLIAGNQRDDEG